MTIKGTIAAGHRQTVEAGIVAYEAGGNAIDAAVAALLASCVTEPCMSGLGGGGFALVRTKDMRPGLLDFFCQTPRVKKTADVIEFEPVKIRFEATTEVFNVGRGSVAVPGMAHGIFELHQRLGTVPLKVLAEPAIQFARTGAEVDWFQDYDFEILEPIFGRGEEAGPIFYKNGQRLAEGDATKNDLLADFLIELINDGPQVFYGGDAATKIAADFRDGGLLTLDDLQNYSAVWRDSMLMEWNKFNIFTNPIPSRGGIELMQALEALKESGTDAEFGSANYTSNMIANLQSGSERAVETYTKWGSTTHISTADMDGNAVSTSVSNGEGSGCFVAGTGIQLNNMLGEAALFTDGLHSWEPDSRVPSLMSPTILQSGNDTIIALGTGGAGRIPSVLAQVIRHVIFDHVPIGEAIRRGRIYLHDNTVELEPEIVAPDVLPAPFASANHWPEQNMFFGGVHASAMLGKELESLGDARRNGSVAYYRT